MAPRLQHGTSIAGPTELPKYCETKLGAITESGHGRCPSSFIAPRMARRVAKRAARRKPRCGSRLARRLKEDAGAVEIWSLLEIFARSHGEPS